MRPREAMRLALRDMYANSWRLVPVNAALGMVLFAIGVLTIASRGALVLAIVAGPFAAALVHCAVTLVRTGNVALADAFDGLRLHWKRGLALGAAGTALIWLGFLAVHFYSGSHYTWPLVFLTVYVLLLLGVYQIILWTLAIAEPDRPLRVVAAEAAAVGAARPGSTLLLGLALLLVNLGGVAAALMPFLTLTIAYSFIAVAHFALPRPPMEDRV
jgi:hypothetical protein